MNLASFALRRLLASVPLLLGVTFVSFLLIVYCGPEITFTLLPKDAEPADIAKIRHQLGYDQPFLWRYLQFLRELITLDFGNAIISGERVSSLLARTIPVSLALVLPGFVLGNLAGIALAILAARYRSRWPDRLIMTLAVIGMSISFLIVVMSFQLVFSSSSGLGLFPVQGWRVDDLADYFHYVAVPTLATVFVTVGYNTRFYRAVIVEELDRDHIRTARAYGAQEGRVLLGHVLRNCAILVVTRVLFSVPLIVVSGSLVLEQYFNVPGVGLVTFDAIASGDQPVLKAVVSLTGVLFVLFQVLADVLYRAADPRVSLD